MYKVYAVNSKTCYHGMALVSANNAEEANSFIEKFQESDKRNAFDSWGYMMVNEDDVIEGVYSKEKGIVHFGIFYGG